MAVNEFPGRMEPSQFGGTPKNLTVTNNAAGASGPTYDVEWPMQPVTQAGQLQYDPTTGQYSWAGPMQNYGGGDSGAGGGNDSPGGGGVPWWGRAAAAAVPAIAGRVASGGGGSQLTPELQQLLALAMKRMQDQEPLFQAINRQAMAGLPASYQR